MKKGLQDILSSSLIRNSAKISVSNIIMYMLPLIVTPVLTRLYTPESFGEWGIFSSFVAIVNIGLFLGFENVIIQAKENEVSHIIKLCMGVTLCVISAIALSFYVCIKGNLHFFTEFPTPHILFIYLLLYAIYTILYNIANRYEQYYTLSFSSIVQGGSQAFFRIILAFVCIQALNGLILGTVIAQGCTALFILVFLLRKNLLRIDLGFCFKRIKQLASQYRNFPLYDAPASMLSFAAFNLPVIILSLYFNKAAIGCFSIILQLLLMPMSLIGSAMGKVYYQKISADNGNIGHTTNEMLRILSVISILPLLIIACGGDKLIVLFLGSQWQSAGKVALCLALWSFPTILTQPLLYIFRVRNQQRLMLLYDILYFILGIGVLSIFCHFSHNLYTILIAYSTACFLVKCALFIKILSLAQLSLSKYAKFFPLWLAALIILIIRLM